MKYSETSELCYHRHQPTNIPPSRHTREVFPTLGCPLSSAHAFFTFAIGRGRCVGVGCSSSYNRACMCWSNTRFVATLLHCRCLFLFLVEFSGNSHTLAHARRAPAEEKSSTKTSPENYRFYYIRWCPLDASKNRRIKTNSGWDSSHGLDIIKSNQKLVFILGL